MDGSQEPITAAETIIEVPAVAFSVVIGLSDRAQITFQSGFASDEDDVTVNARMDRIMRLGARQQSLLEIPAKQKEIDDLTNELDQRDADVASAEVEHQKRLAELNVQVEMLTGAKQMLLEDGYAAHKAMGKQNAFEPKGALAANINNHEAAIKKVVEDIGKLEAEKQVFLDNVEINTKRRQARVALLKDQMVRLQALAEG